MFVYTKENGIQEVTRIPVKYSIDVKHVSTEYRAYRSTEYFGNPVYKKVKPQVRRTFRFMEAW